MPKGTNLRFKLCEHVNNKKNTTRQTWCYFNLETVQQVLHHHFKNSNI